MKQLITIVLDLKRSRVDHEALQSIQVHISMIFSGVLTGADIQNIRSAGLHGLAGILMLWDGTCWEDRFKTVPCLLV